MANTFCPVQANHGPRLLQLTMKIMQDLGADLLIDELPEELSNGQLINELFLWYQQVTPKDSAVVQASNDERKSYYLAFFHLSTDKRSRSKLAEIPNLFKTLVRFMEVTAEDEHMCIFLAGLANMVFEDSNKRALMDSDDIPRIFLSYLRNTNAAIVAYTARCICSLTTIQDFKIQFAKQEGILSTLIENLARRDSADIVTNSAGAIANIAIFPAHKALLVELGALDPLMDVARSDDDETVLHQVSRCFFSLSAEKSNHASMYDKGIMSILTRLLSFPNNAEILTNAVGCFGNLIESEKASTDLGVATVRRIIHMARRLTNNILLDRQLMRVFLTLSQQPAVKAELTNDESLGAVIHKLGLCDARTLRYIIDTLFKLICGDDNVRERVCELGAVQKTVHLFITHSDISSPCHEIVPSLLRFLFTVADSAVAKHIICSQQQGKIIKTLSDYIQRIHNMTEKENSDCKFALGVLATIAGEQIHASMLICHGLLACGLTTIFTSAWPDCRHQAGHLLYNLVGQQGVALSYMCRFGGPGGERTKLESDFKSILRSVFLFAPSSMSGTTLFSESSSKVKEGTLQMKVQCVIDDQPTRVETFVVTLPEAIVNARCPDLSERLKDISMNERVWRAFFEFICTNSIASFGLEGARPSEDLSSLNSLLELAGLQQGLIRYAVWDNPRIFPVLDNDQSLFAFVANTSTSTSSNEPSFLDTHSNTTRACASDMPACSASLTATAQVTTTTSIRRRDIDAGDVSDEVGFLNSGSSEVDQAIIMLSTDWTECMTTRMLSNQLNREQIASDEILLYPDPVLEDERATSLGMESSMICCRTKCRIMMKGSGKKPPMRDRSFPLEHVKAKPTLFIRRLLEEWKMNHPNADMYTKNLIKGKRKHSQISAVSDGTGRVGDMFFRAHKTVLSARSQYFRSLFRDCSNGNGFTSCETDQERTEDLVVDFKGSADVLVVVLRYFYCGLDNELMDALSTDLDLCWRTFLVAHDYLIEGLQFHCERVIMGSIKSLEDAVQVSNALDLINAPFLRIFCAHIAYTDSQEHANTKGKLMMQVLENVRFPAIPSSIDACRQHADLGGLIS